MSLEFFLTVGPAVKKNSNDINVILSMVKQNVLWISVIFADRKFIGKSTDQKQAVLMVSNGSSCVM